MTHHNTQGIPRSDIVAIARELKAQYGAQLTPTLFRKQTGISARVIRRTCGGWPALCRAVGLASPETSRTHRRLRTAAGLRRELRRLAEKLGADLSSQQFADHLGISLPTLYRHGSWPDLRESAGLPRRARREPEYSDDDIMADLMQVYLRAGRFPTVDEHKLWGGRISSRTIRIRYRTWRGARQRFELHRRKHFQKLDPTWTPTTPIKPNRRVPRDIAANVLRMLDDE